MHRFTWLVGLISTTGFITALSACASTDDDTGGCGLAGTTQQCINRDTNCTGVQTCQADGSLSPCVCGGGAGGSAAGGSSGVGGSAGIGGSAAGGSAGVGAAGAGGSAGGNPGPMGVGSPCASAADCGGAGLICLTPTGTEWSGEGPPRGLCTVDCAADPSVCGTNNICLQMDEAGTQAFCVSRCQQGSVPFETDPNSWFPTSHCSGRFEFACWRLGEAGMEVDACLPSCTNDNDCGGGFCNEETGACAAQDPAGLDIGTACDPMADPDPCAGVCVTIDMTNPNAGFCSGTCTLGTFGLTGGCDSDPTMGAPQSGACVLSTSATAEVGDLGLCSNSCDCTAECAPGLVCDAVPADTQTFLGKQGVCAGTAMMELTTCN